MSVRLNNYLLGVLVHCFKVLLDCAGAVRVRVGLCADGRTDGRSDGRTDGRADESSDGRTVSGFDDDRNCNNGDDEIT